MNPNVLKEEVFPIIKEFASWAEEESTEQWIAALVDAVDMYNEEHKLDLSFYDFMNEFMNWFNK